jgi:hypothetical protein
MTFQLPQVQQALAASSALTTIVGTRISQGIAPEDQTRPYVVWSIPSAAPENNLSDRPEEDDQRIQVDCWSTSQSQCRQMAQAAADACEGIGHIVFGPWSDYEADTKLHRWSFDLEVWNKR